MQQIKVSQSTFSVISGVCALCYVLWLVIRSLLLHRDISKFFERDQSFNHMAIIQVSKFCTCY